MSPFLSAPMTDREIVAAARAVVTLEDAEALNAMIVESAGGEFRRPLGDIWNNFGLVSQAGDFDHKVIEAVTNAQDAVLEREVSRRFGNEPVPYRSPREAAEDLLDLEATATHKRIHVEIRDPAIERTITMSITDDGCGMTASQMAETILKLGSSHKSQAEFVQGAFGLGVKSTFRNAKAAIVVSRRAPEMGDDDGRVSVAVVQWDEVGKGLSAYYLTTSDWNEGAEAAAKPWSAAADEVDFPVGTQLILVEYKVKGLHRARSGDPKGFQLVANTRLHRPVIPFRQTSLMVSKPEPRTVYGLARRLEDKGDELRHGRDRLPFAVDGTTYQLPIGWWVFPSEKVGGRATMVADGHVVSFTSSGQIHHHWDKAAFKARTGYNKIDGCAYIVVETDELPIKTRTRLFTPDRASLLPNDDAQRLESSLASFLKNHEDLHEINGELQRQAVESALGSRKTRAVAQRISQNIAAKGFNTGGGVGSGLSDRPPKPGKPKKLKLLKEPTSLEGPRRVTVRPEDVRTLTFYVDAKNSFVERGIGSIEVYCDHPSINQNELAVSDPSGGRVRLTILVPEAPVALGEFTLAVKIPQWSSAAGGLAGPLEWETTLVVTDEPPRPPRPVTPGGANADGSEVALQWRDDEPGNVAGRVEDIEAQNLAADEEYKDLARLGEATIPTIVLNEKFTPLRRYLDSMLKRKGEAAVEQARGRYATAVGVGLLVLRADEAAEELNDDQLAAIARAYARTALSLLPDFDVLLDELAVD